MIILNHKQIKFQATEGLPHSKTTAFSLLRDAYILKWTVKILGKLNL